MMLQRKAEEVLSLVLIVGGTLNSFMVLLHQPVGNQFRGLS